jgi:hypothetical protein
MGYMVFPFGAYAFFSYMAGTGTGCSTLFQAAHPVPTGLAHQGGSGPQATWADSVNPDLDIV